MKIPDNSLKRMAMRSGAMRAASQYDGTFHAAHVYSVFGPWCYVCGERHRWWKFWQTWTDEEHDEPF